MFSSSWQDVCTHPQTQSHEITYFSAGTNFKCFSFIGLSSSEHSEQQFPLHFDVKLVRHDAISLDIPSILCQCTLLLVWELLPILYDTFILHNNLSNVLYSVMPSPTRCRFTTKTNFSAVSDHYGLYSCCCANTACANHFLYKRYCVQFLLILAVVAHPMMGKTLYNSLHIHTGHVGECILGILEG